MPCTLLAGQYSPEDSGKEVAPNFGSRGDAAYPFKSDFPAKFPSPALCCARPAPGAAGAAGLSPLSSPSPRAQPAPLLPRGRHRRGEKAALLLPAVPGDPAAAAATLPAPRRGGAGRVNALPLLAGGGGPGRLIAGLRRHRAAKAGGRAAAAAMATDGECGRRPGRGRPPRGGG